MNEKFNSNIKETDVKIETNCIVLTMFPKFL